MATPTSIYLDLESDTEGEFYIHIILATLLLLPLSIPFDDESKESNNIESMSPNINLVEKIYKLVNLALTPLCSTLVGKMVFKSS